MKNLKRRVYALVETVSYDNLSVQKYDFFDIFIVVLILLNIASVILETVQSLHLRYAHAFKDFEIFSVIN